jgi:hypothetical protein
MKKLLALCLAPFKRRPPARQDDEEFDFLKRVRESGL